MKFKTKFRLKGKNVILNIANVTGDKKIEIKNPKSVEKVLVKALDDLGATIFDISDIIKEGIIHNSVKGIRKGTTIGKIKLDKTSFDIKEGVSLGEVLASSTNLDRIRSLILDMYLVWYSQELLEAYDDHWGFKHEETKK